MPIQINRLFLGLTAAIVLALPTMSIAGAFTSANNLVVIRLGDGGAFTSDTAQPVFLDEFNVGGASASIVQSVAIPSTGGSAVTLPDANSHDGLLNRSVDGHALVFAGYRSAAGSSNPTVTASEVIPRVVVRVTGAGAVDTTTALSDSYSQTTVRAVASDNGARFWVAGDNAIDTPETSTTGGLRFVAALGDTTSKNLSQVQVVAPPPTPDNVRSVGIFGGQLYNSSGSDSSIGKGIFQVGVGLPTIDSQTLTKLNPNDGASTNAFFLADLSGAVPGVDTLYTSTSAAGIGIHKYAKSCVGDVCTWASKSFVALPGIEAMTANVSGSTVSLYATDGGSVYRLIDSTGYNVNIAGSFSSILDSGPNKSFKGLAFAPTVASLQGDYNNDGKVDATDYTVWRNNLGDLNEVDIHNNGDGGGVTIDDFTLWKAHYGEPNPGGGGLGSSYIVVPEPASQLGAVLLTSISLGVSRRSAARKRE